MTQPRTHLIRGNAQSADVELVMVDGRVVKRDGELVGIDVDRIVANAADAQADVLERAGRSGDAIAKLVATVAH